VQPAREELYEPVHLALGIPLSVLGRILNCKSSGELLALGLDVGLLGTCSQGLSVEILRADAQANAAVL
jgi:hypothetical protein